MILDIVGQPSIEVLEVVQMEQSFFEDIQLSAYVKYNHTQEIVDAGVRHRGHQDRRCLSEHYDLVIWSLRRIAQVVCLYQQWSTRIGAVRQVSHRVSEARWNNEDEARKAHHNGSEHDDRSGDSRLLQHDVPFLYRFCLHPIRYDHVRDRYEIFGKGRAKRDTH